MGIPDHLTCLLGNLYVGQETTLEPYMEQWIVVKLGKKYVSAIYRHRTYLTCMQSTSCEMLGWMKHKLELRLLGEIPITSAMQMMPPLWQKWRGSKEPLEESERGEWKSWLKTQCSKKLRSWHPVPSLHGKQMGKQCKQWKTLFSWAPKSLQMVTVTMKLKDGYSLEGKLWPT